jgi:general secretion pathway protein K
VRGDARSGFILVAVLGVTALIAALIGAVSLLVRSAVDGVRAGSDDLALAGLTRAGIELAGYQLYGLKTPFEALDGQQVRLDSGAVTLFVTDESGRIDLNGADPALLAGLARAAGLSALPPASFAARVADWRDGDDERSPGGAEAGDYASAGLDHRPQNDAFRSVADLRWLLGLSAGQAAALAKMSTIHNPEGKVNVLSAGRDVLLALPGMSPPTVDRILTMRRSPKASLARDVLSLLPDQQGSVKVEPGPSYRVRVEARLAGARARTAEVVLTASRTADSLAYVVEWAP